VITSTGSLLNTSLNALNLSSAIFIIIFYKNR
jgi:hypothetical protein